MQGQDKFRKLIEKRPHPTATFLERPHLSRRHFFRLAGAGLAGSFVIPRLGAQVVSSTPVQTRNTAQNVIFILLAGAPSHTDLFDLKVVDGVTPATFNPATVSGLAWPTGIMPKLAGELPKIAVVRSMRAWALVHSLAQTWTQIGRNPAAVLGNVSPNIGSVVAIEKEPERKPGQVFPTFLALNSGTAAGPGYFPAEYAPFKDIPAASGIKNTTNIDGQTRFDNRWDALHHLDDPLRVNSPVSQQFSDYDQFYSAAKGMMYNPEVSKAFSILPADTTRYGSTAFGNACLVAKQVLAANQGTRFVQITQGGWDMHSNIYAPTQLPAYAKLLDDGLSALLDDLSTNGMLDSTLVVVAGEFGRTVGALSGAAGRDHFPQQFALFAGAKVKGGRAIGSTTLDGSATLDPGWSRNRDIKPEDVEATIYSAMGINWTTIRHDDPLGRGFYYVPNSDQNIYGPIDELWG